MIFMLQIDNNKIIIIIVYFPHIKNINLQTGIITNRKINSI